MATPEEELLVLKQFLRFGETRPIVELMTLQCLAAVNHLSELQLSSAPKSFQSNVGAMVERIGGTPGVFRNARGDPRLVYRYKKNHKDTEGPSLLLPFHFPSSALHCLAPPTKVIFVLHHFFPNLPCSTTRNIHRVYDPLRFCFLLFVVLIAGARSSQ